MQAATDAIVRDGVVESIWVECMSCWGALPNKGLFFGLLGAWVMLFQVLGNGTFGYVDTPSLFGWVWTINVHTNVQTEQGPGLLSPFLVLALFWLKRRDLLTVEKETWPPGLGLVVVALFMHGVGYLVQQPRLSIIAFFVGVYGMMGLAWGPRWLRASFFPFFLFLFMVPLQGVDTVVTFPLRMLVTVIVEFVSHYLLGLDVIRVGTGLFDASQTYQYDVAPACSGLRSLTAIFFLATVYGYALFRASWRWMAMLLASFPLAVFGNAVRLLLIVLTADLFGKSAGDWVHENMVVSLLPYVPVIVGLVYLGRRLDSSARKKSSQEAAA
ncbi:MAG TPA: exosortase/archaeosortase family protein [Verrucomicrobiae bacterium]|nr:exosortase/archaeosortase family protein [Verrucomicrobiae bacterium]